MALSSSRSRARRQRGPSGGEQRNRARPCLEALEDRLNLSSMTFTVTTALDDNVVHPGVSLRQAITMANNDSNPADVDIIKFASSLAGKTIKLDSKLGELQIKESVSIQGLGAGLLKIDGGAVAGVGGVRIFDLFGGETNPTHVKISGLTLQNGNYLTENDPEVDGGGAVGTTGFGTGDFSEGSFDSLTLRGCVLKQNSTNGVGGAVAVTGGNLTIQSCTLRSNSSGGEGGAILFDDSGNIDLTLRIDRTTVANNSSGNGEQGGGLCIQGGNAFISRCTFSGNVAGGEGGAIANRPTGSEQSVPTNAAETLIVNTTISGNKSNDDGGGIWNVDSDLTLLNDTIASNQALGSLSSGGGVFCGGLGTTNIFNTIVAGNSDSTGKNDIFRQSESDHTINALFSLIQQSPTGTINGSNQGNIFNKDPLLRPLGFYFGGTTMTQPPLKGSPAINHGSNSLLNGLKVDQNGNPRVVNGTVDIGSVEVPSLFIFVSHHYVIPPA